MNYIHINSQILLIYSDDATAFHMHTTYQCWMREVYCKGALEQYTYYIHISLKELRASRITCSH